MCESKNMVDTLFYALVDIVRNTYIYSYILIICTSTVLFDVVSTSEEGVR